MWLNTSYGPEHVDDLVQNFTTGRLFFYAVFWVFGCSHQKPVLNRMVKLGRAQPTILSTSPNEFKGAFGSAETTHEIADNALLPCFLTGVLRISRTIERSEMNSSSSPSFVNYWRAMDQCVKICTDAGSSRMCSNMFLSPSSENVGLANK